MSLDELWRRGRAGPIAGRGFHYQDAVATELALRAWAGECALRRVVPEGLDDVSLELEGHWLHVQAKSRREHRGGFGFSELRGAWRHLAQRLVADPGAHGALVLERPLQGAEGGFDRGLADVASKELKRAVVEAVAGVIDGADFLARTHLVVMPAETSTAVVLLADKLGLAPATCVAHYAILGRKLADLADENAVREAADPAALTIGEIAKIIDDVSEAVDPGALEEAVRSGVCELVDFATRVEEDRFYSGVDVVVGHVVAGLPLLRPELTGALRDGVLERGVALAVGPSGAGKSALIWMTAYETRHLIRWYRVRRLQAEDVRTLVRLVKGLRPTGAKVGFVVDDVGRNDRVGFDQLVEELRGEPNALVLGACRAEDLFVVATARAATQVRPLLEAELAERIWRELQDGGETSWPAWREPYVQSERLLLEYGHLLTEGTRLAETIASQIARRVSAQRTLELDVLALVAAADAFGAELDATRLAAALAADNTKMRNALERLVDEHLIRERDGFLGGLHELRSRYITQEIHRMPPPTLADTVRRVIDLLDSASLQPFLTRLLLEQAVADDVVIDAVAVCLRRDPEPRLLAAALQALRLVGFRRMADEWRAIFEEEDAAPTNVGLVAQFALHGGDYGFFPESLQRAVERVRELRYVDLRASFLTQVADLVQESLEGADIAAAATVLAALGEVGHSVALDAGQLAQLADGTDLADVRLLLESAYASSPELAANVAEALGGSAALLARLQRERPWLREVELGFDEDGRSTATAEYAYVAEAHQPNANDAVVDVARYLAALAPAVELAVCRAVDATGDTAGFGEVPLADKKIDRRYLPSQAEIAWNRARGRAALAAVAATTETEHAVSSREVVVRSAQVLRRAGDAWARGKLPTQQLYNEAVALGEIAHRIKPLPISIGTVGPLEEGELPFTDPASYLGTMITNQLFVGLFQSESIAPQIPLLLEQVDELAEPERWQLLDEPPLDEVADLRRLLLDLHAVVAEIAHGDRFSAIALQAAGKNGLSAAARVARQRAGTRMQAVAVTVERELKDAGSNVRVLRRNGEPDSFRWPSDEFLVLVDVPSIYAWQRSLELLVQRCRTLLADRIGFYMAPVRAGRIVGAYAVKVIDNAYPQESLDWPDLPLALLDAPVAAEVGTGLSALFEISGIVASAPAQREVHEEEAVVVTNASARANQTLRFLEQLLIDTGDSPLINEIGAAFLELSRAVEEEANALEGGNPVERGVAASILRGLKGEANDIFATYVGMIAACTEWDIDPERAWSQFQEAVSSAP